jgi:hypothetical protein
MGSPRGGRGADGISGLVNLASRSREWRDWMIRSTEKGWEAGLVGEVYLVGAGARRRVERGASDFPGTYRGQDDDGGDDWPTDWGGPLLLDRSLYILVPHEPLNFCVPMLERDFCSLDFLVRVGVTSTSLGSHTKKRLTQSQRFTQIVSIYIWV